MVKESSTERQDWPYSGVQTKVFCFTSLPNLSNWTTMVILLLNSNELKYKSNYLHFLILHNLKWNTFTVYIFNKFSDVTGCPAKNNSNQIIGIFCYYPIFALCVHPQTVPCHTKHKASCNFWCNYIVDSIINHDTISTIGTVSTNGQRSGK